MDIWKWNHNAALNETKKRNPITEHTEHYVREAKLFISVCSQSIIVTWDCISVWFTYGISVKQSFDSVYY